MLFVKKTDPHIIATKMLFTRLAIYVTNLGTFIADLSKSHVLDFILMHGSIVHPKRSF